MKKLKPITNKVLWTFAVGQFGWSLLSGIISTWLVHLYTGNPEKFLDTNGILSQYISQHPLIASLTLFGIITAVGRLFDAITDPLIASWSDRSNFKGGRRIPFLKWGSIPFALLTLGVFCPAPDGLRGREQHHYLCAADALLPGDDRLLHAL